ncbi:hypothetical protein AB7828_03825 [Tardiphaga sp. 215_C5_N2_1]|uniref:hypothetical protein n=1 Tax=Tardiphaga sp. 215_C5_N2_1 TaxID=3240774 RepID=UPI003F896306
MATNSIRALLEGKVARVSASNSATSKSLTSAIKHALSIHNALGNVKEPLAKRAKDEQRNAEWLATETRKAFGERLRELARLRVEVESTARAHAASKPTLPAFDKSDVLAAMETIAVAQRVASTKANEYHKLSPAERLAALRVPTLANIPPSVAERWTEEAISNISPERAAIYRTDQELIEEATSALEIVKHSMAREVGMVDPDSGTANYAWQAFEREHLEPIKRDLERQDLVRANGRNLDAVAEAEQALRAAQAIQSQQERELLKSL